MSLSLSQSQPQSEPVALNHAKRKRPDSPSAASASAAPASKSLKTTTTTHASAHANANANQLQINYLARQCADDLPFITKDDSLPNLLDVLSSYNHVLDRQESLASNLGARPLGPILIKRFERCFDGPPKIIASHSHAKGAPAAEDEATPTVTWLDVVHFAQAHPAQFDLATFSEGRRVCQFYYPQKQVRVQVSEEDFLFINSGRCQDLIPPLPIWEDEEKEVGTCEILEKALRELTNAADMVAARTRQLGHRLKGRRMAIQERRSEQGLAQADADPHSQSIVVTTSQNHTPTPTPSAAATRNSLSGDKSDPSAAIRTDLIKHFQSLPHNQPPTRLEPRRISHTHPLSPVHGPAQHQTPQPNIAAAALDMGQPSSNSVSPAPTAPTNGHPLDPLSYYIENTSTPYRSAFTPANVPASDGAPKHNFSRPLPPSQESSQPYRAICQAHMESLPRGSRVLPPCDRCRRLRMDCLKNLSSCAGCTKKHARCHWKDVRREEVQGLDGFEEAEMNQRNFVQDDIDNPPHDGNASSRHSDDDESRKLSEERLDQLNAIPTAGPPPLRRSELEQHAQATIKHAQSESVQRLSPAPALPVAHQPHEPEDKDAKAPLTSMSNPFARRSEGDDGHHAMDLLRLLSQEATNAAANSPAGAGPGARNNGAFRSVYSHHGPESGSTENPENAPPNGNPALGVGVGVGVSGGDRS